MSVRVLSTRAVVGGVSERVLLESPGPAPSGTTTSNIGPSAAPAVALVAPDSGAMGGAPPLEPDAVPAAEPGSLAAAPCCNRCTRSCHARSAAAS